MARKSSAPASATVTTLAPVPAAPASGSDTLVRRQPPFLMWYDDNPKTPVAQKIAAAIAAYKMRFPGVEPTLVLVNEAEVTPVEGIAVRGMVTVSRHTYWVGQAMAG
ncbi:hypothetical protein A6A03_07035 [Chloroflexus islandicus]|uniref:Uncharacterized protein n=1 Tax=Chloroflexus islandicus TaxID=1707952 RepID=A0A178MLV4_9CHLR|nr:hypothetical protein [Chloroflexus islandicus]OAN49055.1 hypothetical protein A6A03_07035 [Chloroflexus islandicus]